MALEIDFVRRQFPALDSGWIFFDNAGGSQTLQRVVERIGDFMLSSNVQLGASYQISVDAAARVDTARRQLALLVNARRAEEIVMGPTTTAMLRNLAQAMAGRIRPGDEIIVSNADHEVNISPWLELQKHGAVVKFWRFDPHSYELRLEQLRTLLNPRTRLVCMTQTSNIFGTIYPVADIARIVHECGAQICVDAVAYAPHRLIDVQAWDVDYYAFSCYKLYGPHHAVLYGKYENLLALDSIYHCFIDKSKVPAKLEPGNCNYELAFASAGIVDYLDELGRRLGAPPGRPALTAAFAAIAQYEQGLSEKLLAYLRGKNNVRIIGRADAAHAGRVPTISFVADGRDSEQIVRAIDKQRIGIRYGDFYSCRLIDDLGLRQNNGVVRVSMVHYNTVQEVGRLIDCLDAVI